MTKEQLMENVLQMPDSFVDHPYGPAVDVAKTKAGKSFALIGVLTAADIKSIRKNCDANAPAEEGDIFITLKCSPGLISSLRKDYRAVIPGYYSNKNHWNTIILGGDVPTEEIEKMIQLSFDLVTCN